ncbi:MAG TPA: hypothetical protein VFK04_13055 [Gemmatimonadaceae bacterium]|nr:hypothetical protein [Gemmatimonadaceae bacterium]
MPDYLWPLLAQLLPVIAGVLASVTFQYFKKGVAIVDAAPAWVKQLSVVVIAFALSALGKVLGVDLPTDLHAIDATVWTGIISGAIALAAHAIHKGDGAPAA